MVAELQVWPTHMRPLMVRVALILISLCGLFVRVRLAR
jgi:hypothetical protein